MNNFIDGIISTGLGATGTAAAVWVQDAALNVNLGTNDIRNLSGNGAASGILIGDSASTLSPADTVWMHENAISGITSAGGGAAGALAARISLTPTSFFFERNQISDVTGNAYAQGVRIECLVLDAPIINNDFTNLTSASGDIVGIRFPSNSNGNVSDSSGNFFNLPATAYGIKFDGTFDNSLGPMNAGCCWWGSPDGPGPVGPGHGCQVSPNIIYSPWRVLPSRDISACVGNNVPMSEADCKNGGWIVRVRSDGSTFKSQGDCMQYVNNGN